MAKIELFCLAFLFLSLLLSHTSDARGSSWGLYGPEDSTNDLRGWLIPRANRLYARLYEKRQADKRLYERRRKSNQLGFLTDYQHRDE